ncbi:MAG: hypothetical protein H8E26_12315 [FCB group bacterium]|nr:hypothetical protein [FCB group bacterium]MBL7028308.1 hypothetical protein [Candidatus Neomarinimicrobiota bacterium]MBL7121627.1 hypothetical protein [Candidatus Neomarinimicrobiota bacterium]
MRPIVVDRNLLVLEATRLYYEHNLNQAQIAIRVKLLAMITVETPQNI